MLFSLYIDDVSIELSRSKIGCFINNVCMNHVFYADDMCIMAPSAIGLQNLLNICHSYSIDTDINFNPVKSMCMVFKPRNYKLRCPSIRLHEQCLEYTNCIKYLGSTFQNTSSDDDDILNQMRTLYMRSNRLIRLFGQCEVAVKLELFRSYCCTLYCPYLWTKYTRRSINKLRVAYNNVYRRLLNVPR
jgi:hypothetical protein